MSNFHYYLSVFINYHIYTYIYVYSRFLKKWYFMTPNKKIWWLLSIPSSGNLKNVWPMSHSPDTPSQALQKLLECFVLFSLHIVSDSIGTQLACTQHLPTSSYQWSILFICIYLNSLERETQYFPSYVFLSCFFMIYVVMCRCQYKEIKLMGSGQLIIPSS